MLKHFYLFLVLTFVMGLLAGVFIYFTVREPSEPEGPQEEPAGDFEIIVDTYGGCNMLDSCASYRILGDGTFTYVERGLDTKRIGGVLNDDQIATLERLLGRTNFDVVEKSEFSGTCPITYDGLAYRYEIRYKGNHSFDSCVEDTKDELLFDTLNEYFGVLQRSQE